MLLGSHLSVAGGYVNALHDAARLGMNTVQIFTKNQRQWASKPMEEEARTHWLAGLTQGAFTRTTSHASYLINLASPDDTLWKKSIESMIDEVQRAEALKLFCVVLHPGSHVGSGVEAGLARIGKALDEITAATAGCRTLIALEGTVGGGNQLGGKFEELAAMRSRVRQPERIGTCLDTCHITAAGYDASTEEKAARVFAEYDRIVGIDTLCCIHLNDSMGALGSHRDRHEHIGKGHVGMGAFAFLMNDARFADIPMILETEKEQTPDGEDWDAVNLRTLVGLIRSRQVRDSLPRPQPASPPAQPSKKSSPAPKPSATSRGRVPSVEPRRKAAAAKRTAAVRPRKPARAKKTSRKKR